MKNNASLIYNVFLVIGDFFALVLAFVGAYVIRVTLDHTLIIHPIHARTYLGIFLILLPFWILLFALLGLYNTSIYEKRFNEIGRLFIGSFTGMLFVIFINFLSVTPIFPAKLIPIYGFVLSFIFLVLFRSLARIIRTFLFGYEFGLTNILLVGKTKMTAELVQLLGNSRRSGYRVLGVVGDNHIGDNHRDIAIYPTFEEALGNVRQENLHGIIQTELYSNETKNREILEYAQTNHISYRFVPGNTELFVGNIDVELFRASIPVIAVHQTPLFGWGRIVKRIFDLLVGLILLIVTSPLFILISVAELLSGGDVFFRQVRLTRFNNEFKVFKFRTFKKAYNNLSPEEGFTKMGRPDLIAIYRKNGDQIENDQRFSQLGVFLRKTSLDELPQLINIIKGDLSLVGPRPLVPKELSLYEKRHTILSVKSGLTGLAQVSGRKNISFEERRTLDLYYVQNWTFLLDITILLKTIRVILEGS